MERWRWVVVGCAVLGACGGPAAPPMVPAALLEPAAATAACVESGTYAVAVDLVAATITPKGTMSSAWCEPAVANVVDHAMASMTITIGASATTVAWADATHPALIEGCHVTIGQAGFTAALDFDATGGATGVLAFTFGVIDNPAEAGDVCEVDGATLVVRAASGS